MRRLAIIVLSVAGLVLLAVAVGAVDKVPRPDVDVDTAAATETKADLRPVDQTPPEPQKNDKYDTFVDQNNNGVDDRRENLVTKEKPDVKTAPPADSAAKK